MTDSPSIKDQAIDAAVEQLRKENERLRDALREITALRFTGERDNAVEAYKRAGRIAFRALSAPDTTEQSQLPL